MSLHATVNGDPISNIQVAIYLAVLCIPWICGVWFLISIFVDRIFQPFLEWVFNKFL